MFDYCYQAVLTPPSFPDAPLDIDVWSTEVFSFNPTTEDLGTCDGFSYALNISGPLPSSKAVVGTNTITFSPDLLSEVG